MRLKSIKLVGFKSFVDPTTVPFVSNMTAVVGPNGCGKSNIIDAVRWVMGESSAKNLRGESMTDVIFNGSSGRQPVGQATIELLFENNEDKLIGEYASFSEISIKRKVNREGVSQYYLNGTKCRRRDVTDIFLGTGMGPRSYAIIEQGMISKLIESKPEELRIYLEEAAGISKYKERRRETENRMKRTQENLDRLADIREELGKQIQHLKKQAGAAERYAEFKKEERLQTAKLNAIHWRQLNHQAQVKSKSIAQYEHEIETALFAKVENDNNIVLYRTQLEAKQTIFNSCQATFYQSGAEISSLEQQLKYQKNKLIEQEEILASLQLELTNSNELLGADREHLANIEFELETLLPEIDELFNLEEASNHDLGVKEQKMHQWQMDWEQFNATNATTQQNAELEQAKIQQNENRLKELRLRQEKLLIEKKTLSEQISSLDFSKLEEALVTLEESLILSQETIDSLYPIIDQCRLDIDQLTEKKAETYKSLSEKKAILASLHTLQSATFGDHAEEQRQWCLKHEIDAKSRLMDVISVSEGWELAAEQVLESWLTSIATSESGYELPDKQFFSRVILSELNQSLNFISRIPNHSKAIVEGSFAACLSGASALTPYLNRIKTMPSLEQAFEKRSTLQEGESFITQDGCWLGKSWLRYYQPLAGQENIVLRSKTISALSLEIPNLETDLAKQVVQIDQLKAQLEVYNSKLKAEEIKIKQNHHEKSRLASEMSANQTKFDQYKLRIKRNNDDITEDSLNIEIVQESLELARENWQLAMAELDDLTDQKISFIERRELLETTLGQCRVKSRELQNKRHQTELLQQTKLNQKHILVTSISRLNDEVDQRRIKIENITSADQIDQEGISALECQLENLLTSRLTADAQLMSSRVSLDDVALVLRASENSRNDYDINIQSARESLETIRMDAQALTINMQNLVERVEADNFNFKNLLESIHSTDSENSLEQSLGQLATKILRLGSINLAAIDEYQVQYERKANLDTQNDELVEALDTLLSAMHEIDKETRTRFKATFDQVNEGLQTLFPKIFGGGNAYLELTDNNLLETGVVIIARPPGKKNATIHLLSGGEKSLTAIALIFAIFELNPAPFCMLDEVDAPLDDANVGRFANMVKDMSSQVQFIYITHNKVSMEKADQLMGVTMHEPGVSRLVSVDVEEAVAMVES